MRRLNECSCGCGNSGECGSDKMQEGKPTNYMFFGDLKIIKRSVDAMLQMNPQQVDEIITNGHDWAADHIATSKDDIEEVAGFLMNEVGGSDNIDMRVNDMPFVHTFESYTQHFSDDASDETLAAKLLKAVRDEDWGLVKSVSMTLRYRNQY
jgi:hypothetical protein